MADKNNTPEQDKEVAEKVEVTFSGKGFTVKGGNYPGKYEPVAPKFSKNKKEYDAKEFFAKGNEEAVLALVEQSWQGPDGPYDAEEFNKRQCLLKLVF